MHVGTDCSWLDERTDLNMVELASLNIVADRLVHAYVGTDCSWLDKRTDFEQRCWNHHNKVFMHDTACCQGMMK